MGAKTKEQHLWDIAEGKYGFGNEMEMRFAEAMAERDAAQASADVDLVAWLTAHRDFSRAAFGPHPRTEGLLRHIASELDEIRRDPTDLEEWVDVAILAFDGAWRAGHEPRAIAEALVAKLEKNKARTWPDWRTKREDEPIEHVKAAQPVAEAPAAPSRAESDILAERASQRDRWGVDHDDEHADWQLANAAMAYIAGNPKLWPFADGWKPRSRREDLVRAAALLIAEVERLDRRDESFQAPEVRAMRAAETPAPPAEPGPMRSILLATRGEAQPAPPQETAQGGPFSRAESDILAERASQRSTWGVDHDDEHGKQELARAAMAYITGNPKFWPFADGFKPRSRREDLVRAGALVIAEIERVDRAAESFQAPEVRAMRAAEAPGSQGGSAVNISTGSVLRAGLRENEELRARVAELEAAPAWLPIDSAPKDGTAVLGYEPGSGCEVCKWMGSLREWTDCHGSMIRARWWMPIPDLPTLKAEAPGSQGGSAVNISTGSVLRAGLRENEELRARVAELEADARQLREESSQAWAVLRGRHPQETRETGSLLAAAVDVKARADAAEADATEGGVTLLDICRRCAEALGSPGPDILGPQRAVLAVIERMRAAEAQLAALGDNPIKRGLVERHLAKSPIGSPEGKVCMAILADREPGGAA